MQYIYYISLLKGQGNFKNFNSTRKRTIETGLAHMSIIQGQSMSHRSNKGLLEQECLWEHICKDSISMSPESIWWEKTLQQSYGLGKQCPIHMWSWEVLGKTADHAPEVLTRSILPWFLLPFPLQVPVLMLLSDMFGSVSQVINHFIFPLQVFCCSLYHSDGKQTWTPSK